MRLRIQSAALVLAAAAVLVPALRAQKKDSKSGYDRSARATLLHPAIVYITANDDAGHLSLVTPGHEVVVIERNGPWVRVFANTDAADKTNADDEPMFSDADTVTPASGWIRDKGIVALNTPGGDAILYGAAANFEDQATQPHAPKDAANAARLLYRRVAEYFPNSPLAPAALK